MRLIDADHLKNKLGIWWDKQDEIFAEMIDECPTINPQEPILDKIRAIVKEWQDDSWTDGLSYECMIKISELFTESEEE